MAFLKMKELNTMQPLLSRKQAMALLGVGKTKFRELVKAGEFTPVMIGDKQQFRPEDIEAYVIRQQEKYTWR